LFEPRTWSVPRPRPDRTALECAARAIRQSQRPLIIAGGGVIYSEATEVLAQLVERSGIPLGETQAGKGSLPFDHPQSLGGLGVTGTAAANAIAAEADLVIGIGTRYSDFTTASNTAFQHPSVRFVNINITDFDASKNGALSLTGDARVTLQELGAMVADFRVTPDYASQIAELRKRWAAEVARIYRLGHGPLPSQGEVIGALDRFTAPTDIVVNAAGSAPGDLHKLWQAQDPKQCHVEYGYSCMGYEIPGGLGVKLAAPEREVYVLIGDGSYLMMSHDLVTAIQEGLKITVVLVDNGGYSSIGGLSQAVGSGSFGTVLQRRDPRGQLDGEALSVDYAANARSLGAEVFEARSINAFQQALGEARSSRATAVIVIRTDREQRVGSYGAWWDVPVAEVSQTEGVRAARSDYERARRRQRRFGGEVPR
jgi:3D-(3,5/4)-trihydroxycyclohexane-1,2-dione acylhydrolase (decyclizing)